MRAYHKASKASYNMSNNGASGAFKSTSDRPDPTHYRTPEERGWKAEALPPGRGSHSSTFLLNLSAFCRIGVDLGDP